MLKLTGTCRIVASALVLIASSVVVSTASAQAASPPAGLTVSGRALWNFEGLLRQTFGASYKGCLRSLSQYVQSFTTDTFCATHASAETLGYFFTFSHTSSSAFHLVARTFPTGSFGNYPELIRVSGKYVACDPAARTFLVSYSDVLGLSANLACLKPNA